MIRRKIFNGREVKKLQKEKLPYTLLHTTKKISERFTLGLGFHASSTFATGEIRALLRRKDLFAKKKKLNFLDLGCGLGHIVILAAHDGWQAFGIDISSDAIKFAKKNIKDIENKGNLPKARAQVSVGSFFPSEFKTERTENTYFDLFREEIEEYTTGKTYANSYNNLGLDLKDVDLFFHWQIEKESNMLRFFAKYASPGSLFLFIRTYGRKKIPLGDNIKLLEKTSERVELYKKVATK